LTLRPLFIYCFL